MDCSSVSNYTTCALSKNLMCQFLMAYLFLSALWLKHTPRATKDMHMMLQASHLIGISSVFRAERDTRCVQCVVWTHRFQYQLGIPICCILLTRRGSSAMMNAIWLWVSLWLLVHCSAWWYADGRRASLRLFITWIPKSMTCSSLTRLHMISTVWVDDDFSMVTGVCCSTLVCCLVPHKPLQIFPIHKVSNCIVRDASSHRAIRNRVKEFQHWEVKWSHQRMISHAAMRLFCSHQIIFIPSCASIHYTMLWLLEWIHFTSINQ